MQEMTKDEHVEQNGPDAREGGDWAEDQKERSYYYDDAYGYEVYRGDEEDNGEAGEEASQGPAQQADNKCPTQRDALGQANW